MARRRSGGRRTSEGLEVRPAKDWKGEDSAKVLVYGQEGVGKTSLAATFPAPLLLDFSERGSGSLVERGLGDVDVVRITHWEQIEDAYQFVLANEDYRTVVMDTISALGDMCLRWVMHDEAERDSTKDVLMPEIRDYGKRSDMMKAEILKWRDLPRNIVFVAHEESRRLDRDDPESDVMTGPASAPAWGQTLRASVNHIGRMETMAVKHKKGPKKGQRVHVPVIYFVQKRGELYRAKTRSGLLREQGRIISPNYDKLSAYLP